MNLYHNQLTSLPETIGNLSSLTDLDVSANQLADIPGFICNLTSLARLAVGNNPVTLTLIGAGMVKWQFRGISVVYV